VLGLPRNRLAAGVALTSVALRHDAAARRGFASSRHAFPAFHGRHENRTECAGGAPGRLLFAIRWTCQNGSAPALRLAAPQVLGGSRDLERATDRASMRIAWMGEAGEGA
jgi:hypothetical protein